MFLTDCLSIIVNNTTQKIWSLCVQLFNDTLGWHRVVVENTHNGFLCSPLMREWEAKDELVLAQCEVECVTFVETLEMMTEILQVLEEASVCYHSRDDLRAMCHLKQCQFCNHP